MDISKRIVAIIAGLVALGCSADAFGLINPNFTPIHLVKQAGLIVQLEVGPGSAKGPVPAQVVKVLQGEETAKTLSIDIAKADAKTVTKFWHEELPDGRKEMAMLFVGKFDEKRVDDADGGGAKAGAMLHMAGRWFRLTGGDGGKYVLDQHDSHLHATWAGGTEMLLRCVNYILKDPGATVPVKTEGSWGTAVKLGSVSGKSMGAMCVDLAGNGQMALYVMAEGGDRIYRYNTADKNFADATAALKLTSKSLAAVWGDFTGDGLLDLASWDGKALTIFVQAKDGTFEAKPSGVSLPGCVGLALIDVGAKDRAGLVASTSGMPMLLAPQADGSWKSGPLVADGKFAGSELGAASPCVVGDFDGDGVVDVLQVMAKGSLLYRGKAGGGFEAGTACDIAAGEGRASAFVGDFDADGLLDVFVTAKERCTLWNNTGKGKFVECKGVVPDRPLSGEVAYKTQPDAIGGQLCDPNNDGRQGFAVFYANIVPQVFFNRGFRSTGFSEELNLADKEALPPAANGQQAGVMADLNGDGLQDMVLVLASGDVFMLPRQAKGTGLGLRLGMSGKDGYAGPLAVTALCGDRSLGTFVVAPAVEAFIGREEPGPLTLRWQFPGGKAQEMKVVVEEGVARCAVGREGGK